MLRNKMVETAHPVHRTVTEYAKSIIFTRNRTIDHPVYGQDIAESKMEQISAPYEHTQNCEHCSHRHEQNLWR